MELGPADAVGLGGLTTLGYIFLRKILSYDADAFPPCHAKPLKEGRGWPWNKTVLAHSTPNGDFTMRLVEPEAESGD